MARLALRRGSGLAPLALLNFIRAPFRRNAVDEAQREAADAAGAADVGALAGAV